MAAGKVLLAMAFVFAPYAFGSLVAWLPGLLMIVLVIVWACLPVVILRGIH